jgi:uncharacterized protein involved in type VI secretion and phage assembly
MTITIDQISATVTAEENPGAAAGSTPSHASGNSYGSGAAGRHEPCGAGPTDALATTPKLYGVYPALVIGTQDPEGIGRLQVSLPSVDTVDGKGFTAWARLAQFAAGAERGAWFMPEPDDEVLIAFEAGDVARPYVIGALWNGIDRPPVTDAERGDNNVKRIRTRSGASITFEDGPGPAAVTLMSPGGASVHIDQQGVTVTDGGAEVRVAGGRVDVDAAQVRIKAASVQIDSGMTVASGVVRCDTLITNSVVSSSYTPGAGNVW